MNRCKKIEFKLNSPIGVLLIYRINYRKFFMEIWTWKSEAFQDTEVRFIS